MATERTEKRGEKGPAGAAAAIAGARPPEDLQDLLARIRPEQRSLYQRVRADLDELELAAPWELLYSPAEQDHELLALSGRLLQVVEGFPGRLAQLLAALKVECDAAHRPALEDAEFYLEGVHRMVGVEVTRLRREVEKLQEQVPAERLAALSRVALCELAADLKGKYTSALMGATAAIVAEGTWNSVLLEPILFPEKAREFERNQELVVALGAVVETIQDLRQQIPFQHLLDHWRQGTRVDGYALADLSTLRGRIAQLLKADNRRALYSGDFHQIRRRERQLSQRLHELETLHQATWDDEVETDRSVFPRLQRLTMEICALLDVRLLEEMFGSDVVRAVRAGATARQGDGAAAVGEADGSSARQRATEQQLAFLAPLLAREDLKTFFELLLGAVSRRASLTTARAQPSLEAEELAAAGASQRDPPQRIVDTGAFAALVAPEKIADQAMPEDRLETLRGLERLLQRLQSRDNPNWRSLQMLKRVLDRHGRIPPAMMKQGTPFLEELLDKLVPELDRAASTGLVAAAIATDLRNHCLALLDPDLGSEEIANEVPVLLDNVERTLQNLAWLAGQLIARHLG